MKRNFKVLALLMVITGLSIPAHAQHPLLDVAFEIVWGEVDAFDSDAIVILTDDLGVAIQGWDNIPLNPDPIFEWWTITLVNVPEDAVGYKITWNSGEGLIWNPEPAIYGEINWAQEEIFDWTLVEFGE